MLVCKYVYVGSWDGDMRSWEEEGARLRILRGEGAFFVEELEEEGRCRLAVYFAG